MEAASETAPAAGPTLGSRRDNLLSTTKAAAHFGIDRHRLARLYRNGLIRGREHSQGYLFEVDELRADLARLPQRRTPALTLTCQTCGGEVKRKVSTLRSRPAGGVYCSVSCRQRDQGYRRRHREAVRRAMQRHRRRIKLQCAHCGSTLERTPSQARKGLLHYCSIRCRAEHYRIHDEPAQRTCDRCGETFTPDGEQVARTGGRFCSHSCALEDRWHTGRGLGPANLFTPAARKKWLGRWKLAEVRVVGKKGEKKGRAVAAAALQLLELRPEIKRKDAIDALIARFENTDSTNYLRFADGRRRSSRDTEYRAARARIERALVRGFDLLGRPRPLARLL